MTTQVPVRLDSFDRDTQFAVRAVRDAVRLARSLEGRSHASTKPDASPVTVADLAIQAVVAGRLRHEYPSDALIAEEDTSLLCADRDLAGDVVEVVRQVVRDATTEQVAGWIRDGPHASSRFWTLDPIDGTRGFLHGRQYVVALALVVDRSVQMSVIGCPRLSLFDLARVPKLAETSEHGGLAIAVRGHGAWWCADGEETCHRLSVSTCRDVARAYVVQSFEGRHGDPERCSRVLRSLGNGHGPLLMDSQAKHVTIAAGASDLLMRFPPYPGFHDAVWDQAAGSLLIEEAGGRVTDLAGRPLDFTTGRRLNRNTGMLASNGFLHTAALESIRGVS